MSSFFRLLTILNTIGRYRLDKLFAPRQGSLKFKLLLFPFRCYPDREESRGKCLRHAMEELGPIFVKFGQLLSTRPDLIAPDIIDELDHLQDNVAPFDNATFKKIVETALKEKVEVLFKSFDDAPLASASVAQVHTAVLHSGEEVVVKVIRPGIQLTIEKDVRLLRLLARIVEKFSVEARRFRPVEVVDDYRETIFDELDLSREAANASQLRRNWEGSHLLYIPQVYWDYTRQNVMVMERIYGLPVSNPALLEKNGINLKLLAERGVEVFFTQVFVHNFFHADMHPGNVFICQERTYDPSYMAVDMAIVGSLSREDQYYLARNMLAIFRRDYRQVAELHVLSGWVPENTSISGFESAIRAVCEPIFEKPLKEISFGEALITLFRTARRFNMPVQPQLVLLQKTLLNIEGLGRQLYPDLDLWDTAHPFLEKWIRERFHPKTLWKDLKYNSPEWIEKFPQVPHLIFDTMREVKSLAQIAPELKQVSRALAARENRFWRNLKVLTGVAAICAGLYFGSTSLQAIPHESLALLALGAFLILLR